MSEKRRTGRPPLKPIERKTFVLSVRLTAEERTLIDVAAGRMEMSPSDWARRVLVSVSESVVSGALELKRQE